ncbi:hypothetical protein OS493_023880 [Desmophyllum pertusum]|uniref:Uncharacterized protein n=1 Tax=Desmophyllum pertusum TaxID=174260 RepID=A0A9X0CDZ6_9CNID|nr:hypothetical protein OS493_023880 [Desmophyllum pertusum]
MAQQGSERYTTVVAIDFGTTYSGFAFAFNDKTRKAGIHMNNDWGDGHGGKTLKTPTTLLLDPDGKFNSFGYEAKEKYADLPQEKQRQYYYFELFKMELHKSENLSLETLLTAANGKKMKALDVFSHSMWYLKEQAVRVIKTRTSDVGFTVNDIQWILTVPAIWSDAAKQFMREAAYKAGLATTDKPEQLKLALEPEAASLFCRERQLLDLSNEKGDANVSDVYLSPGTRYILMDIGGKLQSMSY